MIFFSGALGAGPALRQGKITLEKAYGKPGEREGFDLVSGDQVFGRMQVERKGDTAHIHNIYGGNYNPALAEGAAREAALQETRNSLGPAAIRAALQEFLNMHPEIRRISGERISGARAAGGYSTEPGPVLTWQVK